MVHKLVVDDSIEQFRDDGEEGNGAVVFGLRPVAFLEELDHLCDFEWVRVSVFINGLVEESC